jgi:hypothetical protein
MNAPIARTTFRMDRTMEFFSTKELAQQIGAQPADWPIFLLKELIDNGLDAAERLSGYQVAGGWQVQVDHRL